MKRKTIKLSGRHLTVKLPMTPNFILLEGCSTAEKLPLSAFTEEDVREIGSAFTEALLVRRAEQCDSPEELVVDS